eukprot:8586919-Lingulodinium_polyedra.AAC.1
MQLRREAQAALGPASLLQYQFRHAGASDNALAGRRPMLEIMARGRWSTLASVRRYAKPGAIQRFWHSVTAEA